MCVLPNKLKVLFVTLMLVSSLAVVIAINGTVYADTTTSESLPEVRIITNGVETTVREGDVLGKVGRGLIVSFELNEQYNQGYVQGEYTEEGTYKITEIKFWHTDVLETAISKEDDKYPTIIEESVLGGSNKLQAQESTSMATTLSGTNTQAWAKSTILCPFGVTATEVYSEVNYIDYGGSIAPINTIHDWYDSALAYLVDSQAAHSSTTDYIWSWTWGKFDSDAPRNQLHAHSAMVAGYPGHIAYYEFWLDRLPDWVIPGVKFSWHQEAQLIP